MDTGTIVQLSVLFGLLLLFAWYRFYREDRESLASDRPNRERELDEHGTQRPTRASSAKAGGQQLLIALGLIGAVYFAIYACDLRTGNDPYPLYCEDNICD